MSHSGHPEASLSRGLWYWLAWGALTAIALFADDGIRDLTGLSPFAVAASYALVSWILVGACSAVEAMRIRRHLQEHHLARWEKLTTVSSLGIGPGGFNSLALLRFTFFGDDCGDPSLHQMQRTGRWVAVLVPVAFFAILPVTVVIAF